jgi:hypothetical protein
MSDRLPELMVDGSFGGSGDVNVSKEVFGKHWLHWILRELQKASPMLTAKKVCE